MISRRILLGTLLAAAMISPVRAAEPLEVVASFSIIGDMVREVGGDRIRLTTLVGPDADAHVYQPTPADARGLAGAGLLVVNGLGFEGWMERLIGASGYKGEVVVATRGIQPLAAEEEEDHDHDHKHSHKHDHGKDDPHAWQSLDNARLYVRNIVDGLSKADPEGAAQYTANAGRYLAEIDAVEAEIKAAVAALPEERRKVVTSHDAFTYFAHAYGVEFRAATGVSTESEASAGDVGKLIRQIKKEKITAVFVENISDQRLLDQIARETGARIGGTLYSDALSGEDGPASTYLDMMRHNIRTLAQAMGV